MTKRKKKFGNITTNLRIKIDFDLPEFSATKIVMWNFHVENSTKSRYGMILDRYLLILLRLDLKVSYCVINGSDGPFERCRAPMVNSGMHLFKILNKSKITPEEYFKISCVEGLYELEHLCNSTKQLHMILYAK